jgi:hypothetical protein
MHTVWSITLRWILFVQSWVGDEIIVHMGFSFRLDFICAILQRAVISFVMCTLSHSFFTFFCVHEADLVLAQKIFESLSF